MSLVRCTVRVNGDMLENKILRDRIEPCNL